MKFMKRAKIYKASNVSFDPQTCVAKSYDWWVFCVRTKTGLVIFNNYNYSVSTRRHQQKIMSLLDDLGIHVDLWLEFTDISLNSSKNILNALKNERDLMLRHKEKLRLTNANPRARGKAKQLREYEINDLTNQRLKIDFYLKNPEMLELN